MKVIDLLNKIAKGEIRPKKFRYDGFTYTENEYGMYRDEDDDDLMKNVCSDFSDLNSEIEIIEEKEIKKLNNFENYPRIPNNDFETELMKYIAIHRVKINELIDAVNELKGERK